MRTNHYIMEICQQNYAGNDEKRGQMAVLNSRYFDGSEAQALAHFRKLDLFKRNKNKPGIYISVRANQVTLADNREF